MNNSDHNSVEDCPGCGACDTKFYGRSAAGLQRLRCNGCGKTWCIQLEGSGNHHIPQEKFDLAVKHFKAGRSIRQVGRLAGIHSITASLIRKKIVDLLPEKKERVKEKQYFRDRRSYFKRYGKRQVKMNQCKRQRWRERVRGAVCLVLVGAERPLNLDELFERLKKRFRGLKKSSLGRMLSVNCEDTFVAVGSYWTYKPSEFPPFFKDEKSASVRARRQWFKRYGLRDELMEKWRAGQKEVERREQRRKELGALVRAQDGLSMMAAAMEISKAAEKLL